MKSVRLKNKEGALHPKTLASLVEYEDKTIEQVLSEENQTTALITQSSSMSRAGEGDDFDVSHDIEDGFMKSLVLEGKSLVNLIQEPSSQGIVLPYEFEDAQQVTINDTKESGALGVEFKGQTLVNLAPSTFLNQVLTLSSVFDNLRNLGRPSKKGTPSNEGAVAYAIQDVKPNTKYTIMFELLSNNITNEHTFNINNVSDRTVFSDYITINSATKEGWNKFVLTSKSDLSNALFILRMQNGMAMGSVEFGRFIIIEGDYSDLEIPYFEGMASSKPSSVTSISQLFDYSKVNDALGTNNTSNPVEGTSFINTGHSFKVDFVTSRNCFSETTIKLPAGTYDISFKVRGEAKFIESGEQPSSSRMGLMLPYKSENWWSTNGKGLDAGYNNISNSNFKTFSKRITATEETTLTVVYHAWGDNVKGWCEIKDIQITPIDKTSTLTLPEEVILRSLPNGVCDTFNTRTGVYTQRINRVTLDGNEEWEMYRLNEDFPDVAGFFHAHPNGKWITGSVNQNYVGNLTVFMQEKFPGELSINEEGIGLNDNRYVKISILKSKLSSVDVAGLKMWLQSNPITVEYELETPVITKINLSSTLKSWNTATHIYSEIPENSLYPILSHSNPTYPVILKPSTKYSIVANSYNNDHTNSVISFNLGGVTASTTVGNRVTTVTTPSTLASEELVMSGRGNKLNNVMVIEGDVVGDEPYFEGICDCKSPILTNIGKNLYYMHQDINNTYGISRLCENGLTTVPLGAMQVFGFTKKTNIATLEDVILNPTSIQEGKTYTISCKVTKISGTSSKLHFLGLRCHNHEGDTIEVSNVRWNDWELEYDFSNTVELSKTVVCNKSFNHVAFGGQIGFDGSNDVYEVTDFQLEESPTQSYFESYKSNILSCNGDKIELTEDMFEQGTVLWSRPTVGTHLDELKFHKDTRIRLKGVIKSKPNTTYCIESDDDYNYLVLPLDSNMSKTDYIGNKWIKNGYMTTTSDTEYITFVIKNAKDTNITTSEFSKMNFTLSEVDKTIVLRSLPNGVCDTLNVETGKYVQRIGEVILDGSENWNVNNTDGTTTHRFFCDEILPNSAVDNTKGVAQYLCDKLKTTVWSQTCELGISVNRAAVFIYNKSIDYNRASVIEWLKENHLKLQYELATPITKTVNLSGYPFAYKNGHVTLSSGSIESSLTPKMSYQLSTSKTGVIQVNQDRLLNHEKRLASLHNRLLQQVVEQEYRLAKGKFYYQTREAYFEEGISLNYGKCELLMEFIENKLYRSEEEVYEMLDVYYMMGEIDDMQYDLLCESISPMVVEVEDYFKYGVEEGI